MQNSIILSDWGQELILDIQKALSDKIRITEADIIDGALFLMCIMPPKLYTNIESGILKIAKEGSIHLSLEEEEKVLQTFKSMYGLDESGRRKYQDLFEEILHETANAL